MRESLPRKRQLPSPVQVVVPAVTSVDPFTCLSAVPDRLAAPTNVFTPEPVIVPPVQLAVPGTVVAVFEREVVGDVAVDGIRHEAVGLQIYGPSRDRPSPPTARSPSRSTWAWGRAGRRTCGISST